MMLYSHLQDNTEDSVMSKIFRFVLSIIFLIIHGGIGIVHLFALRDLLMMFVERHFTMWSWRFIELAAAVVLCISWLVLINVLQHLYEKDLKSSWIPKRFLIILAVQLALYGGTWLLLVIG